MLFSNQDKRLPQHPWRHSLCICKFTLYMSLCFVNTLIFSDSIFHMTTSMKCKTLFFLKVDVCRNLSKGKPIHFAKKYESGISEMTSRKGCVLPLYFPEAQKQQSTSCTDSAHHFTDPRKEDSNITALFLSATPLANKAKPGDYLGHPEITQGYTVLSLGKGHRESHCWHPICQEILLALPSKYIQISIT